MPASAGRIARRVTIRVTSLLLCTGLLVSPGLAPTGTARTAAPTGTARTAAGGTLAAHIDVGASVTQLVTVTSRDWSDTRARMRVWRKRDGRWLLVRGPVQVRLGWNGWVRGQQRRQNSGTTPAGRYTIRSAFGTRPDPGARLDYRHVDGDDVWPYEPRDPATYNILQPHTAPTSHWRSGYRERLADYDREYAYSLILGFNLPRDVHWSPTRRQYVADRPADTRRGGGIFLHAQQHRYTAGCVAGPVTDLRWLVRWLDPAQKPRIVMGPTAWVKRRY